MRIKERMESVTEKFDFAVEIAIDVVGFIVGMAFWGFLLGGGAYLAFKLLSNFL